MPFKEEIMTADEIPVLDPQGNLQIVRVGEPVAPSPTPPVEPAKGEPVVDEKTGEVIVAASATAVSSVPDPALEKAEKTVASLQIADDLKPRAVKLAVAYLKEVRDEAETRKMFESPRERGGVGMDAGKVEEVMKALGKEKVLPLTKGEIEGVDTRLHPPHLSSPYQGEVRSTSPHPHPFPARGEGDRPSPPQGSSAALPRTVAAPFMGAPSDRRLKPAATTAVSSAQGRSFTPTGTSGLRMTERTSTDMAPKGAARVVAAVGGSKQSEISKIGEISVPQIAIPRGETGRPKMQDVSFTPKVMSPVDELREMRMIDFRRLGRDPQHAAEKILAKIELLGEEGAGARVKSVKALKESPLYKEYMEILSSAVARGTAPGQVIEERLAGNKDAMAKEEFEAMVGMGRSMRV